MISNCGKDENNAYSGGQAGDQNGGEYSLIGWYNRPWKCVLRHPDASVRAEIAKLAKAAAQNTNIGYDQAERLSFWNQLQKVNYDPSAIKTTCEADCSSSTASIVKAVGYRLNIAKLKSVQPSLTTYGMRAWLKNAGFDVLTDSKYLTGEQYLLAGDILLNDACHAAINVSNGSLADTSYGTNNVEGPPNSPKRPVTEETPSPNINTLPATTNVTQGDLVAIQEGAKWWTNGSIPSWVFGINWRVLSINGMRAVLGRSEDGKYNIMSPIHAGYLKVVETTAQTGTPTQTEEKKWELDGAETYTVQCGDTLWGIAEKWCGKGWKYTEIQKANNLNSIIIHVGQVLRLPEKE